MAAYGIRHEEIAKVVGCDDKTLRKYFRDELRKATIEANMRVAEPMSRLGQPEARRRRRLRQFSGARPAWGGPRGQSSMSVMATGTHSR